MEVRLVASFRGIEADGRPFVDRARSLIGSMVAVGAVHVGWVGLSLCFAFDPSDLAVLFDAIADAGTAHEGEPGWAIGLAHGDVAPIQEAGSLLTASGVVWYGPALTEATVLANVAHVGEVLVAPSLPELRDGQLAGAGFRIAHAGTLRLRGTRVEPRQPWRAQGRSNLARLKTPALVTAHLPPLAINPGTLVVVRADPGAGGTRLLREAVSRAPRGLYVAPTGSGYEPLGALRVAFARLTDPPPHDKAALEALLAGKGVSLEDAAKLIGAVLWPPSSTPGGPAGVLAIDDAKSVDPATLDACVAAAEATPAFGIIARLDATGSVPTALAVLPEGGEHELPLLSPELAEAIAASAMDGMLEPVARKRWSRLGGGSALSVVEAITYGVGSGQIVWDGNSARPRSRSAGRGKARRASKWIRRRANAEDTAERAVLSLIAVLGGEASLEVIEDVLEKASLTIDVDATIDSLIERRWIGNDRLVSFSSRTERDALYTAMDEDGKKRLHLAAARVLEKAEGVFARVESAWHYAQAGEASKASQALLDGAREAAKAHFETSTTQLIAYARRIDPACEETALELLANALEAPAAGELHSVDIIEAAPASSVVSVPNNSNPPDVGSAPPPSIVPSHAPGSQIAVRLGELAKEALLQADNVALEKWVDGLHAAGESPAFTERMRALARLNRGEIGDALRVLRRARSLLDPQDHRQRCQTSLALGVALSVAGRPQEALLEGMDALARARQIDDVQGAKACLAFLAKLYSSVDRDKESKQLQAV